MALLDQTGAPIGGRGEGRIVCRGCGCDDDHACIGDDGQPCSWSLLDIDTPTGICSECADRARWHPLAFAAIGRANEDEAAEAMVAFARLAPPYRAEVEALLARA